ncbi:FkbM family methyltransferase [Sphingomonas paeninsulae]|jgi:FkbM family methyltransferase|uniref:FkbM family methyltransferase n=1 Tax=Sphingomonas paeninsulae TaxID=2319844 RepID=A0A494TKP9_SPHPE|nr:FkbM family methyltransferase [Sphingomonas paeninsulae]AYJ86396.1 FkbM family methyltransferase [Sphingomonas paeninsulae]
MSLARKVGGRIFKTLRGVRSPVPDIIGHTEYRSLLKMPPFTHGSGMLFDRPIAFADITGYLHSVAEIFAEEVYRFNCETAAPHIIDAGANIGLSVIYFKQLFPGATIVAYEPDPEMFRLLAQNISSYSGISLRQAAAWVEDTELTFYTEGSLAGSSEVDFLNTGASTTVAAVRLKDELRKKHVDFLKIDIEGAENSVLFDIEDELDNVGLLFFEYHSPHTKPQLLGEMLKMVASKGFRYIINGAHAPRLPFIEKLACGFDLQLNVSCFRP